MPGGCADLRSLLALSTIMTDDSLFGEEITTNRVFVRVLTDLLVTAHANGVDIAGAWECRSSEGAHDWEAVITELARTDGDG
jgi:hypothetical protein